MAGANVAMVMASELLGGRYELRGVLGRGGMAEVREGWDTRLSRAVAIKLLHPGFSSDADNRRRFEAEARSAAALSHPNIVAVHDSGEHEGTPFIVMERLPGRTVGDRIARGPMPQAAVRSMLDEVLAALVVAHGAGILHRDIKPGNILFSTDGHTKVTDFGIAKTAEVSHTLTGQIVGTLAYLSPDRLAGKPATIADDLYAVGCVGYEALSGRRPFTEETLGGLARAILDDTPPPLAALRPDVDPRLAAVIERAMARDPRWRFANAEAMRAALWADAVHTAAAPVRPSTLMLTAPFPAIPPTGVYIPAPTSTIQPGRTRRLVGIAAVFGVLTLAAVLLAFNPPFQSNTPETAPTSTSTAPPPPTSSPATTATTAPTAIPAEQPGNGPKKKGNGNGNGRKH